MDESSSTGTTQQADAVPDSLRQTWKPAVNPWLIAAAVMSATFMEVLDTSVANVALPHIAGNLSASTDESTWVLTSYLAANAVILPATGWLGEKIGRQRFLLACVAIFTLASLLCGLAVNLPMLILARIIQGAGGGAMQPIAQAVLLESFPKEKQGQALGMYGLGVVVAPVLGPVIGGWLTDNYSWRWIFFINLPVGILSVFLIRQFVQDPPWIKFARPGKIDALGFGLMALWLASQETVLAKGQDEDWFGSRFIVVMTIVLVVALVSFIARELTTKSPIVNVRLLANRNFGTGTLLITVIGALLYGANALTPIFLQTQLGYPAYQSGLATAPRGMGAFLAMPIAGALVAKLDPRYLAMFGFALFAYSAHLLGNLDLEIARSSIFWPLILNGFSIGFLFIPLSSLAFGTLKQEQLGNASGIFNLMRNVGGSIGISTETTLTARLSQQYQQLFVRSLSPTNPQYQAALGAANAIGGNVPGSQQGLAMIYGTLLQQSSLEAVVSVMRFFAMASVVSIFLVLLMKRVRAKGGAAAVH